MDPTDLSLPGAILLAVVARATELAAANEPVHDDEWRRRMIRSFSIRRRIAPPPTEPLLATNPISQIAAEEPVRGGSSTSANPAKRRKILNRGPSPAEGFTNMTRPFSTRRSIAPPRPLFAAVNICARGGSSTSANPAKRRKILSRGPSSAEGFTNMIQLFSLRRRIAPPPPPLRKFVIEKRLYATDVSPNHNRLSIPISKIDDDFLTEAEKQRLRSDNKLTNYLNVKIMTASSAEKLSTENVKLSRWDMHKGEGKKTSSIYAINGKWNAFVKKNNLTEGMPVQLWFFRLPEELCFALVQL